MQGQLALTVGDGCKGRLPEQWVTGDNLACCGSLRPPAATRPPLSCRKQALLSPLQDGAYWASWFLTHWAGMAVSGLLCAVIGLYPFAHSRWGSGLAGLWAWGVNNSDTGGLLCACSAPCPPPPLVWFGAGAKP